ncbi:hypothetical protein [Streptomyces sp. NPDC055607]
MLISTVTLTDGSPAVVHASSLTYFEPLLIQEGGLPELYRLVLAELAENAVCPAAKAHDGTVVVEPLPNPEGVQAHALVVCTAPACRREAEDLEKRFDGPHPDMDFERAWARKQALVEGEAEDDLIQEMTWAEVMDVNLHWLRKIDPDAVRIFRPGCFTDALLTSQHPVPGCDRFDAAAATQQYLAAKRAEDRVDRYEALFAGVKTKESC